jgi:fibronectin-binding autotransporter adhesin
MGFPRFHEKVVVRFLAAMLAIASTGIVANAAIYTWDGGSSANSVLTTKENWVGDVAPPSTSATHDVIFTGNTRTDPLAPTGNIFYLSITFDANATAAFTIGATDSTSQIAVGTNLNPPTGGNITNNSPFTQTINAKISHRTGTFAANTADLVFNGLISVSGAGATSTGRNTTIDGAKDVYLNGGVHGNGTDTTVAGFLTKNGSGTLFMGECPISSSNNPNTGRWNGRIVLNNGVIRVANNYALGEGGASMGRTSVSGGSANSGRVELTAGVSLPEYFYLGGRQGASADAAHLAALNGGGNITLTGNIIAESGGTEYNLESQGTAIGDLLTITGNITNAQTGTRNLHLRGAGNGVILGNVMSSAGTFTLTKKDAGLWTIESSGNTYTGATTVLGGTLKLGAAASIASSAVLDVRGGAVFDVSAVAGFAVGATQSLVGTGTVNGNVQDNFGATISGGTVGTPGTLILNNNIKFAGGGTLRCDLADVTTVGGGVNDLLSVGGNLSLAGTTTVAVNLLSGKLVGGSYRLIDYAGTLTGNQSNFALSGTGGGTTRQSFSIYTGNDIGGTANQVNLVVAGTPLNLTWKGSGSTSVWDVVGTANWNNNAEKFYNLDWVTFDDTGIAGTVELTGIVNPSSMTVNNSAKDYAFTGGGGISGITGLTKNGTGKLTIANSGANTFSGPIALNAGTLVFNRGDSFAVANVISGAGTLRQEGTGTLTLSGASGGFAGPIAITAGTLVVSNAAALGGTANGTSVNGGTTGSLGGTLDLGGFDLAEPITARGVGVDANFDGFGDGALVNNSAVIGDESIIGNLVLDGGLTFGGLRGIYITGGNFNHHDITVKHTSDLAQFDYVNIQNVASHDLNNAAVEFGCLNFENSSMGDPTGTITLAGTSSILRFSHSQATEQTSTKNIVSNGGILHDRSGSHVLQGSLTFNGGNTEMYVRNSADSVTLPNAVGGGGGMNKTGSGTLVFLGNNTYAGSTTITAGTVQYGRTGQLTGLPGPGEFIMSGGNLRFYTNQAFTLNNTISGATGTVSFGQDDNEPLGNLAVTVTGNNTYDGVTNIYKGAVILTTATGLGSAGGGTTIYGGGNNNGRLELTGGITAYEPITLVGRNAPLLYAPHIVNAAGSNSLGGGITFATGGSRYTLQSNGGLLSIGGDIASSLTGNRYLNLQGNGDGIISGGVLLGSGGGFLHVEKFGTGTWTLAGAWNTYNGETLVSAGTLKLGAGADIGGTSAIEVRSGAVFDVSQTAFNFGAVVQQTLRGNGTVTGTVNAWYYAKIAPGTATAGQTLTIGGLDLGSGGGSPGYSAKLEYHLSPSAAAGNDKIVVVNALKQPSSGTVDVVVHGLGASLDAAVNYPLIGYGSFDGVDVSRFNLVHDTRYTASSLVLNAGAKEIQLHVAGNAPKTLTWIGNSIPQWELKGSSWDWQDAAATAEQFYEMDTVLFDNSTAVNSVPVSGAVYPSSVTVNNDPDHNYTFTGIGKITGTTGIVKTGVGTLTIDNTGNDFTGVVTVNQGTLVIGTNSVTPLGATGAGSGAVVNGGTTGSPGGALELNGKDLGAEQLAVQGVGVGGNGAVVNTTNARALIHNLTLAGDATFGGSRRISLGGDAADTLNFGNYTLTVKHTGDGSPGVYDGVRIESVPSHDLKDAHIVQGTLAFHNTSLGQPNGTITISDAPGAPFVSTLQLMDSNEVDTYLNDVTKNLAFTGGRLYDYRGQFTIHGAVTLNGMATEVVVSSPGTFSTNLIFADGIAGDGGITKTGNGPLTLQGNNTYTGATTVTAGTLELTSTGQIDPASLITNNAQFTVNGGSHAVGVVAGTGTMNVLDGTSLTAVSITQGALNIGGTSVSAAAAVPEPAVWLMLSICLLVAAVLGRFGRNRG